MHDDTANNWTICPKCDGAGKRTQKISKKAQRFYQKKLAQYEKIGNT
jgi:hypothetical protein